VRDSCGSGLSTLKGSRKCNDEPSGSTEKEFVLANAVMNL
jgi:hypothetical protein